MFNFAIFRKTLAESIWSIVLCASGLVAFVVLFSWAMLNMGTEMLDFFSQFPFLAKIFASFGIDVSGTVSIGTMFAVCFTHGVTFGLAWTVIISTATRVTAGEVERGTADMLLSLPVSRMEVYLSTSLVWMVAALLISICPLIGIGIATLVFETGDEVKLQSFVAPAANFFCLNMSVGGLATMFGSLLNRRGPAIGIVVALVFTSVILNFLEQFVIAIKQIGFLSLLYYFKPVELMRDGISVFHVVILLSIALVSWTIGIVVFSRKDIPTA